MAAVPVPAAAMIADEPPLDGGGAGGAGAEGVALLVAPAPAPSDAAAAAAAALPSSSSSAAAPEASFDAAYVARVLPALSLWLSMSMLVILFNKYLFSHAFPFPASLTCIHMLFSSLATAGLRASGHLAAPPLAWGEYARSVLPIGLMFAFSLVCSNQAAMRLTVSFVQMVKAATPMLVLGVAAWAGTERATRNLVVIVSLMTLGVGIASYGELSFDGLGMALQVAALTVEAFRLQAIQLLMQRVLPRGSSPFAALSYFAPVCFLLLLPWSLLTEPRALAALAASQRTQALVLLNALSALGLNGAVVWLVSFESGPLTLTLAGVLKDVALIVTSVWLFGNRLTLVQLGGYSLALLGLNCYHLVKAGRGRCEDGSDRPFLSLLREAASDRVAAVMAASMVCVAQPPRAPSAWRLPAHSLFLTPPPSTPTPHARTPRQASSLLLFIAL